MVWLIAHLPRSYRFIHNSADRLKPWERPREDRGAPCENVGGRRDRRGESRCHRGAERSGSADRFPVDPAGRPVNALTVSASKMHSAFTSVMDAPCGFSPTFFRWLVAMRPAFLCHVANAGGNRQNFASTEQRSPAQWHRPSFSWGRGDQPGNGYAHLARSADIRSIHEQSSSPIQTSRHQIEVPGTPQSLVAGSRAPTSWPASTLDGARPGSLHIV